jgi:hypothetical protein
MRAPTTALLWEIWRQRRWTVAAIAGLTMVGRLLDESSTLTTLLGMIAFLLLFAVFNYTDSSDGKGIGSVLSLVVLVTRGYRVDDTQERPAPLNLFHRPSVSSLG